MERRGALAREDSLDVVGKETAGGGGGAGEFWNQATLSVILRPAATASPGNLLAMQDLRPEPQTPESKSVY